jgi:hypothetical protein
MLIVLRWWSFGGIYCPSPSPPGFPLSKDNRRGLLSPLHCVTLRSQTRPSTAQRGRDSPRPVAGGREVEKNANVRVCVFFPVGRLPASPAKTPPTKGRTLPARIFVFPSRYAQSAPRLAYVIQPPPEDWQNVTFNGYDRPTAKADRRRPTGDETKEDPHTATSPAMMRNEPPAIKHPSAIPTRHCGRVGSRHKRR